MQKKRRSVTELLKDVAVVVLLVVLINLCTIYMLSYQTVGAYAFTKQTMATLSGESVKYQYAEYFDPSVISPKFVGFRAGSLGENIGFFCLGGANGEIVGSLTPFYEKLFGDESHVEVLAREEGAELFSELLQSNHIYVVYENDLPKSMIYAMALGDATVREISGEYIREILIVPERYLYSSVSSVPEGVQIYTDVHSFYAVARDTAGNYYRYTTSFVPSAATDISFNTNYYLTYTTKDAYFYYEYAGLMEEDRYFADHGFHSKVSETTAVLTSAHGLLPSRELCFSYAKPTSDRMEKILDALCMNPVKVTSFTASNGACFYYAEGCHVSVAPNGRMEYIAHANGGLPLSVLFDYLAHENEYDVSDYVGASLVLARNLESAVFGKNERETALCLSDVFYDGETTTVCFGYAVDGLPVYFEGKHRVLTLKFSAGSLQHAEYDLYAEQFAYLAPQASDMLWNLRVAVEDVRTETEYAYAYYLYDGEYAGVTLVGRKMEEVE